MLPYPHYQLEFPAQNLLGYAFLDKHDRLQPDMAQEEALRPERKIWNIHYTPIKRNKIL